MNKYLLILPVALLVTYSQVAMKWRAGVTETAATGTFSRRFIGFVTDPVILSAYAAALLASFAWLYVITRLPLSTAFPLYIGVTFVMVMFCGWFFLSEAITLTKVVAVLLILSGILVGAIGDA
jgi:multidrug transporter EmrE-like cation transporter